MLYDTVRNPNAPYIPPVGNANSKDTMQSTQQRLNREVFERFKNSGLSLPHESFVAVVQVGKYIFLAIMIPPYLCFYGIPKWLYLNLFPQMFGFLKNESLRIGRFMSELTKRIPDIMKGVLEQLIGDSLKIINQRAKNFWRHLQSNLQNLSKAVVGPIVQLNAAAKALRHSFVMASGNFFLKIGQAIVKGRVKAGEKAVETFKKIVQTFSKPLKAFDKMVFTPLVTWTAAPFIKAASTAKSIAKKTSQAFSAMNKKIQKTMQPFVKAAKTTANFAVKVAQQIIQHTIQPLVNLIQPPMKAVADMARRSLRKFIEPFAKVGNVIKEQTNNVASSVVHQVQNIFQLLPNGIAQMSLWMWRQIPGTKRDNNQEKKHSLRKFGRFLKKSGKMAAAGVSSFVVTCSRKISQGLSWLAKVLRLFLSWLKTQLIDLPKKIRRSFVRLSQFIWRMGGKFVYGLRLTIAWAWALTVLGFIAIRNFLEEGDKEEGLE